MKTTCAVKPEIFFKLGDQASISTHQFECTWKIWLVKVWWLKRLFLKEFKEWKNDLTIFFAQRSLKNVYTNY